METAAPGMPTGRDLPARDWLAIGGLTVLAAALRGLGLGRGLWLDEYYGVVEIYSLSPATIFTTYAWDFNHPLYSLLAGASVSAFGDSAWAARLPAAVFGVATVPVLYLLAREATSRFEAVLATALLAVSYHHVWFSQNARGYTMLAFFSVVATWLLLRGLREDRWAPFLAYGVAVGLGVYTHLTMVFLVVGHALACGVLAFRSFIRREESWPAGWRRWKKPAAGMTLGAVLTLALYAPILSQVLDFFLHQPSGTEGLSTPSWALAEAVRSLRQGLGAGMLVGLLVAGAIGAAGLWSYSRQPALFWVFVLPFPVTVVGALVARGTMYPRFFFFLVGIGILIMVRGAVTVGGWLGRRVVPGGGGGAARAGAMTCGLLVLALAILSLPRNYRFPKQDYAAALGFAEARAAEHGDPVATAGPGTWPIHHYFGRNHPRVDSLPQLEAVRGGGRPTWMIYTLPRYLEPDLREAIQTECRPARIFPATVSGGELRVCVFPPAAPAGMERTAAAGETHTGGAP